MSIAEPERFRILAVDYGTKRIGLAISDELRMLASARGTIVNDAEALASIVKKAQSENVRTVVLGLPLTLSGGDSEMTSEVRRFGGRLRVQLEAAGIKLALRDERLTSVLANSNIASSSLPKGKREQKSLRDEEAARILLQDFLDHT